MFFYGFKFNFGYLYGYLLVGDLMFFIGFGGYCMYEVCIGVCIYVGKNKMEVCYRFFLIKKKRRKKKEKREEEEEKEEKER